MRAIVIASGRDDNGVLLKRPVGETLLARAVRTAKAIRTVRVVYGMTDRNDYAEHFNALNVLQFGPIERLGSEPVICLDAHYPLLGPEMIEKAAEVANILLCPVQSLAPVAENPALSYELIERIETVSGLKTPEHVFSVELDGEREYDVIYWVNVLAFREGNVAAAGWTEFSIPAFQQALARPPLMAQTAGSGWAAEIMVDVIAEVAGKNGTATVFWTAPEGADEFIVTLYRTTGALTGSAKPYTMPGLMHADPVSGCLVNPSTGEKLANRQAMPPFMERCWALIAGTARDVSDILMGKRPKSLRGVCLNREEATCVKHDVDVLRLRRKLMATMETERTFGVVSSESGKL